MLPSGHSCLVSLCVTSILVNAPSGLQVSRGIIPLRNVAGAGPDLLKVPVPGTLPEAVDTAV